MRGRRVVWIIVRLVPQAELDLLGDNFTSTVAALLLPSRNIVSGKISAKLARVHGRSLYR